jgi:hypothetical protein
MNIDILPKNTLQWRVRHPTSTTSKLIGRIERILPTQWKQKETGDIDLLLHNCLLLLLLLRLGPSGILFPSSSSSSSFFAFSVSLFSDVSLSFALKKHEDEWFLTQHHQETIHSKTHTLSIQTISAFVVHSLSCGVS